MLELESGKTLVLPPARPSPVYKRISKWSKQQRRWVHIAATVLIVIVIVAVYCELRLLAICHTDSSSNTAGNVTETKGMTSSEQQHSGDEMSDILHNTDSYLEDFDKLQAHLTSLSSSSSVSGEVATNKPNVTRWRHMVHKMVSTWRQMDSDIELWQEQLKYMQQAGKFLLLKCLHRDLRAPDGRVERWANVTQLNTVDDVFHLNRIGPHTITLKRSGFYLTTAAIKLRLNSGTSMSYISYAMRSGTNSDVTACHVFSRDRCEGRKTEQCETERYDETCLMTSVQHMRAGEQLTIYDTSVQYTEQLEVVISDSTFWAVVLLV